MQEKKKKRLAFFLIRGSAIYVAKKQCKLFQLFCSLSKPREVDAKSMFKLGAFFLVELECKRKTVIKHSLTFF